MNEPESPSTEILASLPGADGSRFEVRRVTLPVGTSTGWHYHEGWQTGFLLRGGITHSTESKNTSFDVATPLIEQPGVVHVARSTGENDAELLYLCHIPAGAEAAVTCGSPTGGRTDGDALNLSGPADAGVSAVIGVSTDAGVTTDAGVSANADEPGSASPEAAGAVVAVRLGRPLFVQALRYTAMYGPKPFAEALLIYLDNGSYKILSPGEEHYGSYVSATPLAPTAHPRHVSFLSWPSADWDRNVASHTLTFNVDTGAYIQTLVLPDDPVPHAQAGYALSIAHPGQVDMTASWEQVRVTYGEVFEQLTVRENLRAGAGADE